MFFVLSFVDVFDNCAKKITRDAGFIIMVIIIIVKQGCFKAF